MEKAKIKVKSIIYLIFGMSVVFFLAMKGTYEAFFILLDLVVIYLIFWILVKKNWMSSNLFFLMLAIVAYFELPQIMAQVFGVRTLKLNIVFNDISAITSYWILKFELLIVVLIFLILINHSPNHLQVHKSSGTDLFYMKKMAYIFMFVSLFFAIIKFQSAGGLFHIMSLGYSSYYSEVIGKSTILHSMSKIGIMGIFLYIYYFFHKNKNEKTEIGTIILFFLTLIANILVPLYAGSRNSLFLLTMMLIALALKSRRVSKHFFAGCIIIVSIYLVFALYSDVRFYRGHELSWKESIYLTIDNVSIENFIPTNTEFGYPPATTYLLISQDNLEFLYGKSLLYDVVNVVPNIEKYWEFEVPSTWFVKTYFPKIYQKGGGVGFSYLAEAYINFGVLLSFLFFIPTVLIIALLDYISRRSVILDVLALFMIPNTFLLARSAFSRFFLEGIVISFLFPLVCFIIIKRIRWK